jgi:hypothetical protein
MFHVPEGVSDGMAKAQVMCDDETRATLVALMLVLPDFVSWTLAPLWKPLPTRSVIETVVPAFPSSGIMSLNVGFGAVVVAVVLTVAVVVLAAVEAVVAEATAALFICTEETETDVTLTGYIFSTDARDEVEVSEFIR